MWVYPLSALMEASLHSPFKQLLFHVIKYKSLKISLADWRLSSQCLCCSQVLLCLDAVWGQIILRSAYCPWWYWLHLASAGVICTLQAAGIWGLAWRGKRHWCLVRFFWVCLNNMCMLDGLFTDWKCRNTVCLYGYYRQTSDSNDRRIIFPSSIHSHLKPVKTFLAEASCIAGNGDRR